MPPSMLDYCHEPNVNIVGVPLSMHGAQRVSLRSSLEPNVSAPVVPRVSKNMSIPTVAPPFTSVRIRLAGEVLHLSRLDVHATSTYNDLERKIVC